MRSSAKRHWIIALVYLFLGVPQALAGPPPDITENERALLPRWCNRVMGWASESEFRRMVEQYGDGWNHMHHHCWALIDIARADRRSVARPPGYADPMRAIDNLDYVLRNTTPEFVFRTEVLTQRSRILARYVGLEPAIATAQQLVKEWPTFGDGYTLLADLLLKAKKRDEALQVLSIGSERASDKDRFARQRAILPIN